MGRYSIAGFVLVATALAALPSRAEFSDFRGLWVSRFEYSSSNPSSVQTVMSNAASLGITDVMFQVRGQGDAYYDSNFEPRSEQLSGTWDPLQTAIDAAHSNGIKVHAWLNTMPIWRGTSGPVDGSHSFYNTNPSFRRFDINGVPEDPTNPNGEYASANPLLPEVHTHINNVVNDIVTNYEVDGIHLDYIRWLGNQNFNTLPHDAQSHQLFQQATGLNGASSANAVAYRSFIKDRVTDLVGSIKNTVNTAETAVGRTVDLSAAVWRDPDIAEIERLQDYRTWLENDLVDIMIPMIYLDSNNDNLFLPNLLNTLNIPTNTRVAPGLGAFLHDENGGGVDLTVTQLERLNDNGTEGATFFSYSSFFNSGQPGIDRQNAVIQFYNALDPGAPTVLDDFELDEGHFHWPYDQSPASQTFGLSAATTIDRVTSEAHKGVGSQLLNFVDSGPGSWQIRHDSGLAAPADPASNEAVPSIGYIGFWLKTADSGLSVQIALDDPGTADRGTLQAVIADDQWHLYEWDLEDDTQWDGWVTGDGSITGTTVTIDSIFFYGDGDAIVYLDTVGHNPAGSLLPAAGDFDGDFDVDGNDLSQWQGDFGLNGDSDADDDSDSDGADFLAWQRNFSGSAGAVASLSVPEPGALGLLGFGIVCLWGRAGVGVGRSAKPQAAGRLRLSG